MLKFSIGAVVCASLRLVSVDCFVPPPIAYRSHVELFEPSIRRHENRRDKDYAQGGEGEYNRRCDDENNNYDFDFEPPSRRLPGRRRRGRQQFDDLGGVDGRWGEELDLPSSFGRGGGWRLPDSLSKALLAGVFLLGVGLGVTVDSEINTDPRDLASRDAIDQAAPNPELCATMASTEIALFIKLPICHSHIFKLRPGCKCNGLRSESLRVFQSIQCLRVTGRCQTCLCKLSKGCSGW